MIDTPDDLLMLESRSQSRLQSAPNSCAKPPGTSPPPPWRPQRATPPAALLSILLALQTDLPDPDRIRTIIPRLLRVASAAAVPDGL